MSRVIVTSWVPASVAGSGTGEPLFNAGAGDTSVFFDDFQSYSVTSDLDESNGGKYWLRNGSVALQTGGGGYLGSSKYVRFDYTAAGDYANEIYTTQHHNALLSTATKVVVSFAYRNTGTLYDEKQMIIRDNAGGQRSVLVGWNFITPTSLQNCWYDGSGNPLFGYVQPRGNTPAWSRDGADVWGGPTPHFLGGQIGYPTAAFPRNDGAWHFHTFRFTKDTTGGFGAYEAWIDGVKFMEYLGNNPARCEYGGVWSWNSSNTIWDGDIYFCGTTSGGAGWGGGATVDYDAVRVWVPA